MTRLLLAVLAVLVLVGARWTETRGGVYSPNVYEVAESAAVDSALEAMIRRN